MTTTGDQRTDAPIHALGGTGMFVKEVQQAVLDGRADVAVHSAKDLPVDHPRRPRARGGARARRPARRARRLDARRAPDRRARRHRLGAAPRAARARRDPTSRSPSCAATSPPGSRRPPSSTRWSWPRPRSIASGCGDRIAERLDPAVMLPQVGQGALAVECRADDDARRASALAAIDDPDAHAAVDAERAFLAAARRRLHPAVRRRSRTRRRRRRRRSIDGAARRRSTAADRAARRGGAAPSPTTRRAATSPSRAARRTAGALLRRRLEDGAP